MAKPIIYEDGNGWKKRSLVKDTDGENEGPYGIPLGPPDIRRLDWDLILKQINNALVEQGLFTWSDVQHSSSGLQIACTFLKRELVALYRQEEAEQDEKTSGTKE